MTMYQLVRRPSESERRRICVWLEQHGIDPNAVDQDGWIETRPQARQIAWVGFVFEIDGDGRRWVKSAGVGRGAETEVRILQLESPPLPFPAGITCVEAS